jgi:hypothetical protein
MVSASPPTVSLIVRFNTGLRGAFSLVPEVSQKLEMVITRPLSHLNLQVRISSEAFSP